MLLLLLEELGPFLVSDGVVFELQKDLLLVLTDLLLGQDHVLQQGPADRLTGQRGRVHRDY